MALGNSFRKSFEVWLFGSRLVIQYRPDPVRRTAQSNESAALHLPPDELAARLRCELLEYI
jgi:hypothetical protein